MYDYMQLAILQHIVTYALDMYMYVKYVNY